jgi:2-C-methyl-D-erythritol 4-phosphate cytidylyltransferase
MPSDVAPDFAVLIPAAGRSLRFAGGDRSKLAEHISDRPVLAWATAAFLSRGDVAEIIIAAADIASARELLADLLPTVPDGRVKFVRGGTSRAESVLAALLAVSPSCAFVAVHDGARPFISRPTIDRVFAAARAHGAAGPALPVELTIKQATGPLPAPISRTIPRHTLWAMQTPQAARRADLLAAFAACPIPLAQVTDDLQLLELTGRPAFLVEGDPANIKITRPEDLHHPHAKTPP